MQISTRKCVRCHYEWLPRVTKPRMCPVCKHRLAKLSHIKKKVD